MTNPSGAIESSGRRLAIIGGGWGAACALALGGLRFALAEPPERDAQVAGSLAFAVVYLAPFALALLAARWQNPAHQAAAWTAGSLVALLASFTAFSGVSLIFLPAVPMLGLAALGAVRRAGMRQLPRVALLGAALAAINVVAFVALFSQQDGRCWTASVEADGSEHWQEVPYAQTMTLAAGERSQCDSDIITLRESGLSLGLIALAGLGLAALLPRWKIASSPTISISPEGDHL